MKVINIVDHLLKAGRDGIGAAAGIGAVENVKHNGFIGMIFKIALHHRQLIQVCE